MRLAQYRSSNLRGDQGIEASKKDSNSKLLSIMALSHKISHIRLIQLQLSEKFMNVGITVLKAMPLMLSLEQLLIYLNDSRDIRLIAIQGSPFILDSFGRCNEFYRLSNQRNRQLEQPCGDNMILDEPRCTTKIPKWVWVIREKRETTINL